MGHYDSCYEHEEEQDRAERAVLLAAVLNSVRMARREFTPIKGVRNEVRAHALLEDAEVFLVARLNELR